MFAELYRCWQKCAPAEVKYSNFKVAVSKDSLMLLNLMYAFCSRTL